MYNHGVINRNAFTLGGIDFWIDYQDNTYFGGKGKYYVPSSLIGNDWEIDFTKQFRTYDNCKDYIIKCVKTTCKNILKELT